MKLANTIEKDIQLTAEVPSEKKDKKLPVLDLKVWVREIKGEKGGKYSQIEYEFYEKEMVTPRVINSESALSNRIKRQTLANEIIRIRKNTCESEREGKKVEQMTRFAWKLHLHMTARVGGKSCYLV